MKTRLFFFFLFLGMVTALRATHNRAGEIVYTRIAPYTKIVNGEEINVFNYLITVTVYTDHGDNVADRCMDTVIFGDGQRGIAHRMNGVVSSSCNCQAGTLASYCGSLVINHTDYKVKKNVYTITHEYPGAGTYTIQMYDPNRNNGVHNIPNSDQQPFYLESVLVISNYSGPNSSPIFNCEPIYQACLGRCFYHNPCAFDPDGDSLSYGITTSRGYGGTTVPGYFYPETGGGFFGIDEINGTVTWCTPQVVAEYNIAFIVYEWKKNLQGNYVLAGYVLRDMQVVVKPCLNDPPVVAIPPDTCVEAGTQINRKIWVSDPNPNQNVNVTGQGGAFAVPNNKATLSPIPTQGPSSGFPVTFNWNTTCDHVRQQPYQTELVAVDTYTVSLAYYASWNIRVVPPTIKNVVATPMGSSMKITWNPSICTSTVNPLVAYKIYRMDSCVTVPFTPCQTGIPATTGFKFLGQTNASGSSFIDNNGGNGLVVGKNYSYLVIGAYKDSTQTFASAQACAKLIRNIPIITKVDVITTSPTNGAVNVAWERPLTNAQNLDTMIFAGPYTFHLRYRPGSSAQFSTVATFTSPHFLGLPVSYTHTDINTADLRADYQLDFVSGTVTVGYSPLASSVYLKTTPSDRKIQLNWSSEVPWNNYSYKIWKKNPGSSVFNQIATTTLTSYLDKDMIANNYTYCYKITAYGEYSDPGIPRPLINNSEEACAKAVDNQAPCSPSLSIVADCPAGVVSASWNDVRKLECGDDVVGYQLYYKSTVQGEYQKIYEGQNLNYTLDGLELVSGCYMVLSIDSAGNKSQPSPDFCIENCPIFELPNVVSANGDDINDFYKAVRVRQIKEIDLKIYDRWGTLVYSTHDPYFKWNTQSQASGELVAEGTFFYICDVFEPRLQGIVKRNIRGYLQVIR